MSKQCPLARISQCAFARHTEKCGLIKFPKRITIPVFTRPYGKPDLLSNDLQCDDEIGIVKDYVSRRLDIVLDRGTIRIRQNDSHT